MPNKPKSDYETGYRRPPTAHRFRPGVSGNPAGRPKKTPTAQDLIEREARRLVKIKTPDGIVAVSKLEVVIRKLYAKAMEGDLAAMRLIMQLTAPYPAEEAGVDHAEPIDPTQIDDEMLRRMLIRFADVMSEGVEE